MPKKTKNRSSKQAKQRRQSKSLAARQDRTIDAVLKATQSAFPTALAAGQFRAKNGDQETVVTLEDIRQRVNALDGDDQIAAPLEDLDQVKDMLRDELDMGLVFLHPDGSWRLPEEYLPKAGQV
jgi:hypothetical protein